MVFDWSTLVMNSVTGEILPPIVGAGKGLNVEGEGVFPIIRNRTGPCLVNQESTGSL